MAIPGDIGEPDRIEFIFLAIRLSPADKRRSHPTIRDPRCSREEARFLDSSPRSRIEGSTKYGLFPA